MMYLILIILSILNLYIGFHGVINPFNIFSGGFSTGLLVYVAIIDFIKNGI